MKIRIALALSLLTALSACSKNKTQEQTVSGALSINGAPAAELNLNLQPTLGKSCDPRAAVGDRLSAITGTDGLFNATRKVPVSQPESPIVQEDTLCIHEGETWTAAWHGYHSPEPQSLAIACAKTSAWVCTVNGKASE